MYKSEIKLNKKIDCSSFSKDGSYMIAATSQTNIPYYEPIKQDLNLWHIDDNLSFKNYHSINDLETFSNIHTIEMADNFTKILIGSNRNVISIDTNKWEKKILIEYSNGLFSANPSNFDLITFINNNQLFTFDQRNQNFIKIKRQFFDDFTYSIQYHPYKEHLLLIASDKNEVHNFDLRNLKSTFYYSFFQNNDYHELNLDTSISVKKYIHATYNKNGDKILVTKNNYNPILFNSNNSFPVFEFNEYGYYNSLKDSYLKSSIPIKTKCCFAGQNDEYIVCGSNNFSVFMWEIPKKQELTSNDNSKFIEKINSAKLILEGHRSIIKQVNYNHDKAVLSSLGIEPSIKLWSKIPFENSLEKCNFTNSTKHNRSINLTYKSKCKDKNHLTFDNLNDNFFEIRYYDYVINQSLFEKIYLIVETKFNFNFSLEDFNQYFSENYLLKFEQDLIVIYLKSFIVNYKENGKIVISKLISSIDQIIKDELEEKKKDLSILKLTLVFEVRKIFQIKKFLTKCILCLKDQLTLSKKLRDELNSNGKKDYEYEDKTNCLKKITINLEKLLNESLIIIEENKKFFKKCNFLIQTLFNRIFDLNLEIKIESFLYGECLDLEVFFNNLYSSF